MAVLGLRFCARAFSSCGKWGPLFITVHGPLTIMVSLVVEHRLQTRRLSNCGSRAQLLRGMWDLPRPGLEPVSPALAGGLSTTAPPGKPGLAYSCSTWRSSPLLDTLNLIALRTSFSTVSTIILSICNTIGDFITCALYFPCFVPYQVYFCPRALALALSSV